MAIKVQVKLQPQINTSIKKLQVPFIKLEELIDVNASGLQDGYTIVFNATTQTWVVQQGGTSAGNLDGGIY